MKKTYEKPELYVEQYDVEDVITASGLGQTSTDGMQTLLDDVGGYFGNIEI